MKIYVLWTETGREYDMKNFIENTISTELYERVLIPTKDAVKRIGGGWKKIQQKLFPGYFFVETERIEEFHKALRSPDTFLSVVKTGDEYSELSEREDKFIKRLVGDDGNVEISVGFIENDNVVVTDGPLVGLEGMITKIDRHKRIATIAVDLFGRISEVQVGLEIVSKNN